MSLTIVDFWSRRLAVTQTAGSTPIAGWRFVTERLPTFVEPPLTQLLDFGDSYPENASVILVSAPGAVGKSTLAREIAAVTGAMLVDLSETGSVGSNFIIGGLTRCDLMAAMQGGAASLIIDGLDEARVKVTSEAFCDFFGDIAYVAQLASQPIVLMGRTGSVIEAWMHLMDHKIEPAVLQIEFHPIHKAKEFVLTAIRYIRSRKHFDGNGPDSRKNGLR